MVCLEFFFPDTTLRKLCPETQNHEVYSVCMESYSKQIYDTKPGFINEEPATATAFI